MAFWLRQWRWASGKAFLQTPIGRTAVFPLNVVLISSAPMKARWC
jgi:hypothetical protein